jgi:CubicO group peptidase (beta-lactamase class C family)
MRIFTLIAIVIASGAFQSRAADYASIDPELESVVQAEMRDWGITGISVALVDDQEIVYSKGFGDAKRDSIFRAGSISKLFNALAVMQQVKAGNLDLDAPIPVDQLPINPFLDQPSITLRQILSHRSGLQREAPVGSYLDDSQPGILASVESIKPSVLVTRPAEKTRYSNIAPTLAGHLVELATGKSFVEYQTVRLQKPLGMTNSSWTLATTPKDRIIVSNMRVADGRGGWTRREAPLFDLGTIPAENLFTTADDLGRFASALINGGNSLITRESLELMWTPQFTDGDTGFGLGFAMGTFNDRKTVGHSGAVYGYSTSFIVLPTEKLAVIVLGNEDIANGPIRRIQNAALSLLLHVKFGDEIPSVPEPFAIDDLSAFAGEFESQSYWAKLEVVNRKLVGDISGQPTFFSPTGELTFTADSRISDAANVRFEKAEDGLVTGFEMGGQRFVRVPKNPTPLPPEWRSVLGSYGLDFIPIVITERHGHLHAMTENMVDYRLTPVNRNVCALPPGMYVDEEVVFLPDRDGTLRSINYANMVFNRRD